MERRAHMDQKKRKKRNIPLTIIGIVILIGIFAFVYYEASQASNDLPPQELITANMNSTQASFSYSIQNIEKTAKEGGYTTYTLTVSVLDVYKGDLAKNDKVTVIKTIESSQSVYKKNQKFIGSYDTLEDGSFVTPDVAYDFNYSKALGKLYMTAAKSSSSSLSS